MIILLFFTGEDDVPSKAIPSSVFPWKVEFVIRLFDDQIPTPTGTSWTFMFSSLVEGDTICIPIVYNPSPPLVILIFFMVTFGVQM